jgi:hypothetical protein
VAPAALKIAIFTTPRLPPSPPLLSQINGLALRLLMRRLAAC